MRTICQALWDADCTEPEAAEKVVGDLLRQGDDPNGGDESGATPLHYASMKGFFGVVKLLIQHGANVNACSKLGHPHQHSSLEGTPLQTAVEYKEEEIVVLLLKHGADPMTRSRAGDNPFLCAASDGNVRIGKLLLEAGAEINCRATPSEAGFYFPGETALHIAVRYLNAPYIIFLLENGADVHARDAQSRTAFDLMGNDFKFQGLGPFPKKVFDEIRGLLLNPSRNSPPRLTQT